MARPEQDAIQKPNNPEVSEWEQYIGFGVVGLVASVAIITLIQYASLVARYVYAPFTTPVWIAGNVGGTMMAVVVIFFYALICLGIAAVSKFVLKKKYFFWITAAALWLFVGVLEIGMTSKFSLLTRSMDLYCNPTNSGLLAILSCQNGVDAIQANGTVTNVMYAVVPNIVLCWFTFYKLATGIYKTRNDHPRALMTQIHTVDSLIKDQKQQYAHLLFYDKVNPNTMLNTVGQMRLMDSSRKFIFENDLVANFTIRPDLANSSNFGKQFGKKPVAPNFEDYSFKTDELVPVIDAVKFEKLMNQQLGEPWAGVENLQPEAVILLAIALPRACCLDENIDKETADAVKTQLDTMIRDVWHWMANSIDSEGNVLRDVWEFDKLEIYREIIYDWIEHKIAQEYLEEHAYVNTFLLRTLEEAKKLGVMQPSNFRWLKTHNRALWSVVQNVNRPSGYAENIGTVSHYKEERSAGKRINKPKFQGAYNGLVDRAREFKYDKDVVEAWHNWKTKGDPTRLVQLGWVSLDNIDVYGYYTHEEYLDMLEA
ncbi:secretion/conjugation apparatus DotM-related subunit [Psychrobacter celer]|uniref:secretion/conjugation apparatus DotM-related subunit n=1 Tax=Psychrobacter celer TaxID=306572 RepID=UPI003FD1FB71